MQDEESRPPAVGEIQVRLHASSLNFHDYLVVSGRIPTADGRIPMSDGAGEVVAIGDGVDAFRIGDRVISAFFPGWSGGPLTPRQTYSTPGDGQDGYARDMVTVPQNFFTLAPAHLTHAEAATLCCAGLTAWRALFSECRIKPGETVLVQGSGGVALFALQFAKLAGARVISISSSDAKLERLRDLGADLLLNYREHPQWGERVSALTDGRGVDHIIEIAGGDSMIESTRALRNGGKIALIGALAGSATPISAVDLVMNQTKLLGITVGNMTQQRDMVRAIDLHGLRPVIDRSFALDDLAEAINHQLSSVHFGKISINIASGGNA